MPLWLSLFSESRLSSVLLTCLVIVEKLWHENWLPVSFHIGIQCIFFNWPSPLEGFFPLWHTGLWATLAIFEADEDNPQAEQNQPAALHAFILLPTHVY